MKAAWLRASRSLTPRPGRRRRCDALYGQFPVTPDSSRTTSTSHGHRSRALAGSGLTARRSVQRHPVLRHLLAQPLQQRAEERKVGAVVDQLLDLEVQFDPVLPRKRVLARPALERRDRLQVAGSTWPDGKQSVYWDLDSLRELDELERFDTSLR